MIWLRFLVLLVNRRMMSPASPFPQQEIEPVIGELKQSKVTFNNDACEFEEAPIARLNAAAD